MKRFATLISLLIVFGIVVFFVWRSGLWFPATSQLDQCDEGTSLYDGSHLMGCIQAADSKQKDSLPTEAQKLGERSGISLYYFFDSTATPQNNYLHTSEYYFVLDQDKQVAMITPTYDVSYDLVRVTEDEIDVLARNNTYQNVGVSYFVINRSSGAISALSTKERYLDTAPGDSFIASTASVREGSESSLAVQFTDLQSSLDQFDLPETAINGNYFPGPASFSPDGKIFVIFSFDQKQDELEPSFNHGVLFSYDISTKEIKEAGRFIVEYQDGPNAFQGDVSITWPSSASVQLHLPYQKVETINLP